MTEAKDVFNPLSSNRYRNLECLCGSGAKLKHCHGKSTQIPSDMWRIARAWERYLLGEITIGQYNTIVKVDNGNKILDKNDEKFLSNFFLGLWIILSIVIVIIGGYYVTG